MRAMKKHLLRAVVASIAGAVATVAMTYLPIHQVNRGQGARQATIFRGEHVWASARDEVFGVRWSNLWLHDERLLSPVSDGELPSWAEPPPGPYPDGVMYRVGTLASGWPFPSLRARWIVTDVSRNFPVRADVDDQDTSIFYAADDFVNGNRGGGPTEVGILWKGALADFAIYAAAAWLLLGVRARLVIRREGAAAAR
jgi:hypothetical protein